MRIGQLYNGRKIVKIFAGTLDDVVGNYAVDEDGTCYFSSNGSDSWEEII